ncbi:hypothetical protein KRP22_014516 [Phytophthora ramorum]|nr:Solute carrier family 49 member A3 [Phytophthora ramorum]
MRTMTTLAHEAIDAKDGYGTLLRKNGHQKKASPTSPSQFYQKWLMLAILSTLSAVNQAICYSYAPIDSIVEARWQQHMHSEHLITVFFILYIPGSFLGSWIMDREGLRFGIVLGGVLQTVGASLRYYACSLDTAEEAYVTLFGQILASLAMPFVVNSPAVLSANWFPPSMRATSTSIGLNANNFGTALVYLAAPFIVRSSEEVPDWNLYVAVAAGQWASAFSHTGFWHTVVAFSVAECIFNSISALLGKFLAATDFSQEQVGIVGAAFIMTSLIGGQCVGHYVDKRRSHKTAMQVCLFLTGIGIAAFRLVPKVDVSATLISLLSLGAVLGPLQPIVLELGVECAHPTSEATVTALQQLSGNILSAIAVPGLSALQRTRLDATSSISPTNFFTSPEWILVLLTAVTFIVFCFFNGKHKRYAHESKIILPRSSQDRVRIVSDPTS